MNLGLIKIPFRTNFYEKKEEKELLVTQIHTNCLVFE